MADNKTSFVLYTDLIHVVRKLPREMQGDLFMTILAYVNDENPVVEDFALDLVFEPIKNQLKRDLKKWEGEKLGKSDAGKLGNLKRWSPELYKQVLENKITIDDAVAQSHSDKRDRTRSQTSHPIANVAVNVNDNVNVTVSEEATETDRTVSHSDIALKNFKVTDLIIKNLLEHNQLIGYWSKVCGKNFDGTKNLLKDFLEDKKMIEKPYTDLADLKSHISNWFRTGNLESNSVDQQGPIYKKHEVK